jgi:hypothetical protein
MMISMRNQMSLLFAILSLAGILGFTIKNSYARVEGVKKEDAREAMVTALSATGPDSSLGDQARVFDRLTGTWNCEYTFHSTNGTVTHDSGELRFGWIIDGLAIQDLWISYPKNGEERSIGTSIRFFDNKSKLWRVIFINPRYSGILSVQGGLEGNQIVLRGEDSKGAKLRWSFMNIQTDSFVWHGETSYDGGKTWRLEEEHHMWRRSKKPQLTVKSLSQSAAEDPGTDMIHELRSDGPNPGISLHSQLFNRFVGTWDLDSTFTAADGKTSTFRGSWIFGWVLDGLVVQDVLIEEKQESTRKLGTTLRFYDAKIGQWRVVWIPPSSGDVIELKGGAVGDRIVLLGRDVDGSDLRWSFNDIHSNSFVWRGETSSDGGKTWRIEQEMHLKRRVPGM